jgi:hypothetical protein
MFAKVFEQIFDSSISEDYMVRHVFMDLLVLADRSGVVDMTLAAISRRTNVPVNIIERAIERLSQPDTSSRSEKEDGRRIAQLDVHRNWGWYIVNYSKYRDIRDEEARKSYFREYQRKRRGSILNVKDNSRQGVNRSDKVEMLNNVTDVTQADADADADTKTKPSRAEKRREGPTRSALAKSRHAEFKAAIGSYWKSKNQDVEMPWGAAEGRELEMWLRETPETTVEQFRDYLRHRFRSDVVHTDRPSKWIRQITSFAGGPVDRYGKPMNGATGALPIPKPKNQYQLNEDRLLEKQETARKEAKVQ